MLIVFLTLFRKAFCDIARNKEFRAHLKIFEFFPKLSKGAWEYRRDRTEYPSGGESGQIKKIFRGPIRLGGLCLLILLIYIIFNFCLDWWYLIDGCF